MDCSLAATHGRKRSYKEPNKQARGIPVEGRVLPLLMPRQKQRRKQCPPHARRFIVCSSVEQPTICCRCNIPSDCLLGLPIQVKPTTQMPDRAGTGRRTPLLCEITSRLHLGIQPGRNELPGRFRAEIPETSAPQSSFYY